MMSSERQWSCPERDRSRCGVSVGLLAPLCISGLLACSGSAPDGSSEMEPRSAEAEARVAVPEERLRFAVTPIATKSVMEREYGPLTAHLAESLAVPVELVIPESYADITDRVVNGDVDAAILSPLAYVLTARRREGLRVIATPIAQGAPTYASYILVREDSGLAELEDLEGGSIAFVDRRSTSGFLYPYAFLLEQGIEPEEFFGKIEFKGDHAAVIEALRTKKVDAGATFAAATEFLDTKGSPPDLRILAKTGRIPYDAVVVVPSVSETTAERLREALLALNTRTEQGRQILRSSSGINGFLAADDRHYDDIRRVLERVGTAAGIAPATSEPPTTPQSATPGGSPLDTKSGAH